MSVTLNLFTDLLRFVELNPKSMVILVLLYYTSLILTSIILLENLIYLRFMLNHACIILDLSELYISQLEEKWEWTHPL